MSVRCGNTKVHGPARLNGFPNEAHHGSAAEVRQCFTTPGGIPSWEDEEGNAQAQAEMAAEQRNERWFEERGANTYAGSQEEARDRYFDGLAEAQAAASAPSFVERFTAARAAERGQAMAADNAPEEAAALAEQAAEPELLAFDPVPAPLDTSLLDGTYTLPEGGGHRTFRLRTQGSDARFAPGKRVLSYLGGPDNESDYVGFAFVEGTRLKIWSKYRDNVALAEAARYLLADPAEALVAAECRRCHRTLTVPSSIDAGLGPECAKKVL